MKKVAIFIDHENLARSMEREIGEGYKVHVLLRQARKRGAVIVGKAYVPDLADSRRRYTLRNFYYHGVDPVYTPSAPTGKAGQPKSLGDPMLICDIMQTLYERPAVDVFIICSGDKDMIPVLRKVAEKGKEVVVIGIRTTSADALIAECKKLNFSFVNYAELHGPIARRVGDYSKRFSRFPPKTSQ